MTSSASTRPRRAKLLRDDWLSPQLESALAQVFARFDVDHDGVLALHELQAFSRSVNGGEELGEEEIQQVQDYFETREVCGQPGLTRAGFMQMYYMQTESRPGDTLQDLLRLGYSTRTLKLEAATPEQQPEHEPEPEREPGVTTAVEGEVPLGEIADPAEREAERKRRQNRKKRQKKKAKARAAAATTSTVTADGRGDSDDSVVIKTTSGKTMRLASAMPGTSSDVGESALPNGLVAGTTAEVLAAAVAAAEAADAAEFGANTRYATSVRADK